MYSRCLIHRRSIRVNVEGYRRRHIAVGVNVKNNHNRIQHPSSFRDVVWFQRGVDVGLRSSSSSSPSGGRSTLPRHLSVAVSYDEEDKLPPFEEGEGADGFVPKKEMLKDTIHKNVEKGQDSTAVKRKKWKVNGRRRLHKRVVHVSEDEINTFLEAPVGTTTLVKPLVHDMIASCRSTRTVEYAERAEAVLRKYLEELEHANANTDSSSSSSSSSSSPISPGDVMFNIVMDAWSKVSDPDARGAHRAEKILRLLPPDEATTTSYNTVINAYANRGITHRAQALMEEMLQQNLTPNAQSVMPLLLAYANSGQRDSGFHAEECLNVFCEAFWRRQEESRKIMSSPQNGPISLETLLQSVDGSAEETESDDLGLKTKGNASPLAGNFHPDIQHYTMVIRAYGKDRTIEAAQRAEGILRRLEEDGARLLAHAMDSGIDVPDLTPDRYCYNYVLEAWAGCARRDPDLASSKAYEIFDELVERYVDTRNPRLCPNVRSFSAIINSMVQCGKIGRATSLFERAVQLYDVNNDYHRDHHRYPDNKDEKKPLTVLCNLMLKAYKSDVDGADRVVAVMNRLNVPYDYVTYCALIAVQARSNRPDRIRAVEGLLHDALRQIKEGAIVCNDRGNGPVVLYSSVTNACSHFTSTEEKERERAFLMAHETFEKFREEGLVADDIMVSDMIRCCGRLLRDKDKAAKYATRLFHQCAESGQVGASVLQELNNQFSDSYRAVIDPVIQMRSTPSTTTKTKHHPRMISVADLPPEWSRNLEKGRGRPVGRDRPRRRSPAERSVRVGRRSRQAHPHNLNQGTATTVA